MVHCLGLNVLFEKASPCDGIFGHERSHSVTWCRKFYIKRSTHDPCKGLEPTVIVENSVDLDNVDSHVVPKPSRGNKEPISSFRRGGDLDSSCMEFDGNWEPMVCNPNHGDDKPWHCVSWGKLANPPLQERFNLIGMYMISPTLAMLATPIIRK